MFSSWICTNKFYSFFFNNSILDKFRYKRNDIPVNYCKYVYWIIISSKCWKNSIWTNSSGMNSFLSVWLIMILNINVIMIIKYRRRERRNQQLFIDHGRLFCSYYFFYYDWHHHHPRWLPTSIEYEKRTAWLIIEIWTNIHM